MRFGRKYLEAAVLFASGLVLLYSGFIILRFLHYDGWSGLLVAVIIVLGVFLLGIGLYKFDKRNELENVVIRGNQVDGRYGPADPEYAYEAEEPYIVWKFPYAYWGPDTLTYSSYMTHSIFMWVIFFSMWLTLIFVFGLAALVVMPIFTAFLGVVQYVAWKAGRNAAEELNWAMKNGIKPPLL